MVREDLPRGDKKSGLTRRSKENWEKGEIIRGRKTHMGREKKTTSRAQPLVVNQGRSGK